jgi:hypothetical protein
MAVPGGRGLQVMSRKEIPDLHKNGFVCPVCGHSGLWAPPRDLNGDGSGELCNCCSFDFGFSDNDDGWTYRTWRAAWIADGMRWQWGKQRPPEWWDPEEQLRRVVRPSFK